MYARLLALPVLVLVAVAVGRAEAQEGDSTKAGEVTTPYPTITNLAVEWLITGDENLNSVVTVRYRTVVVEGKRFGIGSPRKPGATD